MFCPMLRRNCACELCAWYVDNGCAVAVIASELLRRREREELEQERQELLHRRGEEEE